MRVTGSSRTLSFKEVIGTRSTTSQPGRYLERETINRQGTVKHNTSTVRSDIIRTPFVNGWRAPQPYSFTETDAGWIVGTTEVGLRGLNNATHPDQASWVRWEGAIAPISADKSVDLAGTNDWNRLSSRAASRLKNQQVNLAMVLATRKQTVDLLAESAGRLVKAYSHAKRRDFSSAARELGIRNHVRPGTRSAASGWLQLQFGWRPLVNDIYGLYNEACSDRPDEDMVVVRASERTSKVVDSRMDFYPMTSPQNPGSVSAHLRTSYHRDLKVVWWFKLNSASVHAAARNGLTNPAMVAWDLVPFSFVVDWLLPVGQYLNNLDATLGFTYLGGSRTEFHRNKITVVRSTTKLQPAGAFKSVWGRAKFNGSASYVRMERTVVGSPSGALHVRNPFSTFTVASTAALILQRKKLRNYVRNG